MVTYNYVCTCSTTDSSSCPLMLYYYNNSSFYVVYVPIFLASCEEGDVRLVVGDHAVQQYLGAYSENYDDTYYEKDGLLRGRVEVCERGQYSPVCMDSWDYVDASVICRQLGFSFYGEK